ncbi:hypothetical protein SGPA1_21162 [Streptomyces misionensis JCM 4497]
MRDGTGARLAHPGRGVSRALVGAPCPPGPGGHGAGSRAYDRVDPLEFLGVEVQVAQRAHAVRQLLGAARTDQGGGDAAAAQHPGQGQLGEALAAGGGDLRQRAQPSEQVLGDRLRLQEGAVTRGAGTRRDAVEVAAGEQALLQRGVDDGAGPELVQGVEQALVLGAPVEQGVARLVDQERGAESGEDAGGLPGLLGGVVGDADVERLALLHRRVQGAHRLLQRSLRVGAVGVEDVDVLQAHPPQALVQGGQQVLARAELPVRARPHQIAGLGGDHQFVAVRGQVGGEGGAERGLGGAGRRAVVVGQVEMGDAQVERPAQDGPLGLHRTVGAEVVPQAERQRGELQPAAPGAPVGHLGVTVGGCGVQRDSRGWALIYGPQDSPDGGQRSNRRIGWN